MGFNLGNMKPEYGYDVHEQKSGAKCKINHTQAILENCLYSW